MITWLQSKNKFLVVVMWITVVAFIGVGFVGWGSYQYGSKSSSIAMVGDVNIKRVELQNEYNRLYSYYNQLFDGNLPQAQADELQSVAMQILINQAYLINLGNDFGIVVSDDEVANKIVAMDEFKKDGVFNKELYISVLGNARMTIEEFEESMKKNILLAKLSKMFDFDILKSEFDTVASSIFLADNIKIKIINQDDIKITITNKELKEFWKANQNNYMDEPKFDIGYISVDASKFTSNEEEAREYFKKNRVEFLNEDIAPKSFEDIKPAVLRAVQFKKAKKEALKKRIALKKGKVEAVIANGISLTNDIVPVEDMKNIQSELKMEVAKPIKTDTGFVVVKLLNTYAPKPLSFEEAKYAAKADLEIRKLQTSLEDSAKKELNNFKGKKIGFVTRSDVEKIKDLSTEEASLFLNHLFSVKEKKGYVNLGKKIVLYNILEQRLFVKSKVDENRDFISSNSKQLKKSLIDTEIIKYLQGQYKLQQFYKGE